MHLSNSLSQLGPHLPMLVGISRSGENNLQNHVALEARCGAQRVTLCFRYCITRWTCWEPNAIDQAISEGTHSIAGYCMYMM